jgi:hypothetical protein
MRYTAVRGWMNQRELLAIMATIILSGSYSHEHGYRLDTEKAAELARMQLKAVETSLREKPRPPSDEKPQT